MLSLSRKTLIQAVGYWWIRNKLRSLGREPTVVQKQGDGAGRFLGVFCSDLLYQLRFCGVVEGAWCVVQGPRRVLILLPAVSVARCLIPWGHDVTICKMGWLGRLEKLHSVEVKGFGSECLSLNLRPPLTSSTTLGKLLSLSDPESSHF